MGPIKIVLARPESGATWSVSIVAGQHRVIWASPEAFDSADKAYYRAIGELVLRSREDEIRDRGNEALQEKRIRRSPQNK